MTLVDNGFNSGTSGNTLASPWTPANNGGTTQYINTPLAPVNSSTMAARLRSGASGGLYAILDESTTGGLNADTAEIRFWHRVSSTSLGACAAYDRPGTSAAVWYLDWNGTNVRTYVDRSSQPSPYNTTGYHTIGTIAANTWYQYRLTFNFTAHTYKVYQRTSLADSWTQLGDGGSSVAIPMRSASVSSTTGIEFTSVYGTGQLDVFIDEVEYSNAGTGFTASSAPGVGSLGSATADAYGRVSMTFTEGGIAPASLKVYRATSSGGSFSDVTSNCTITDGGSTWSIVDKRPKYGTPSISLGSTAYYKVLAYDTAAEGPASTYTNEVSATSDVVRATVELETWADLHTEMATQATRENNTHLSYQYAGYWLVAAAYTAAFHPSKTTEALTDLSTWWTYVKANNVNADYLWNPANRDTGAYPYIYVEHHHHAIRDLLIVARLLRYYLPANSTANSLRADIVDIANRMGKAAVDLLGRATLAQSHPIMGSVSAWATGATIAKGEVRKPTAGGTRAYRALNAGTTHASTEPTWPTTAQATVTDNGITWQEMSFSFSKYKYSFNTSSPYSASSDFGGSPARVVDQDAVVAASYALMLADSEATDFGVGGSYRSTAQTLLAGYVQVATSAQFTTGSGQWVSDAIPYSGDTNYGSYTIYSLANVVHLLPGTYPAAAAAVSRGLDWLASYATEPTLASAGSPYGYEIAWRYGSYRIDQRANPLPTNILYTSAFHPSAVYSQPGQAAGTHSGSILAADFIPTLYFQGDEQGVLGVYDSADTWTWSEAATRTITRGRTTADTWAWSEAASSGPSQRTAADAWAWSDSAGRATQFTRLTVEHPTTGANSEYWVWSETAVGTKGVGVTTTDTWAWSEAAAGSTVRVGGPDRYTSDSWAWADTADVARASPYRGLIFDYDMQLGSWWLHDPNVAVVATWDRGDGPRTVGAVADTAASEAIDLWTVFADGALDDDGFTFESRWSGPFHTLGAPDVRKRVTQVHVDGRGTADLCVATDFEAGYGDEEANLSLSPDAGVFGGAGDFGGTGTFGGGAGVSEQEVYNLGTARAWSITLRSVSALYWELDAYTIRTSPRKD